MKKIILFFAAAFICCAQNAANLQVATFEEYALADTVAGVNSWTSGSFEFYTYADISEMGVYYYGFSVSAEKESTSTGFTEPYRSAAGGAYAGEKFGIWESDYYGTNIVKLSTAMTVPGFMVCNNAYTVNEMANGGYGKKFEQNDYLILYCIGMKEGNIVDTIRCNLASNGKYINQWTYVDLSSLGEVDEVKFDMDGSDKGEWGLNTPAYFCLDNFGSMVPEGYVTPEMASFDLTSVTNIPTTTPAIKRIVNGQLIILHNGYYYNALGKEIK